MNDEVGGRICCSVLQATKTRVRIQLNATSGRDSSPPSYLRIAVRDLPSQFVDPRVFQTPVVTPPPGLYNTMAVTL